MDKGHDSHYANPGGRFTAGKWRQEEQQKSYPNIKHHEASEHTWLTGPTFFAVRRSHYNLPSVSVLRNSYYNLNELKNQLHICLASGV
ncbi:MAG TPA: hypothetical protein VM581_00020 [Magnetospirillaceae bacterium]|nr:hypothetical protein [Magnetospirillaceae bacterium]